MKPNIIIITGYLASGKSTFARRLSEVLNVPCLVKDTFKTALCVSVSPLSNEEKSQFSAVTFDAMMYVVERLVETGLTIIIEGNFVPFGVKKTDEAGVIKALAERYDCRTLTYKFVGNTECLHKRFIERDKLPERGQVNVWPYQPSHDEFIGWCRNLDAFTVGREIIEVDTTDFEKVDFNRHIETAQIFIRESDK